MADFSGIIAQNASQNATLTQGHAFANLLVDFGFTNPRLYANPTVGGNGLGQIPEVTTPSDPPPLPPPAVVDTSTSLNAMSVPSGLPIYLQARINEFSDFITVGEVIEILRNDYPTAPLEGWKAIINSWTPGLGDARVSDYLTNLTNAAVAADMAELGL